MTRDEAYSVLGLRLGAKPVDVRRAFKRLALAHHPDRNPSQPDATTRFRRVLLAYEILDGKRAPTPAANSAEASPVPRASRNPQGVRDTPTVDDRFAEADEGSPIPYPTAEEIRNLSIEATHPGKLVDRVFLVFVAMVLLWIFFGWLAPTKVPAPDPKHETTP
jgi:hypothetical protein